MIVILLLSEYPYHHPCLTPNHTPHLIKINSYLKISSLDLREVVRVACLQRAKDVVRRAREKMGKMVHNQGNKLYPITHKKMIAHVSFIPSLVKPSR